jgi:plastocyanin
MGTTMVLPQVDRDLAIVATMPKDTVGEELPSQGVGSIYSAKWKVTLGGYTQQSYSQVLGFKPGTKLTIRNLSTTTTHTLDVVKVVTGPPADFPKGAKLPVTAAGDGKLEAGYASGPIKPGKSVTVTLVKEGIYLIGCAFHYDLGMHDVLLVGPSAGPGPQATPPSKGGGTGSGSSGSGW